jgi:hypothetical protein
MPGGRRSTPPVVIAAFAKLYGDAGEVPLTDFAKKLGYSRQQLSKWRYEALTLGYLIDRRFTVAGEELLDGRDPETILGAWGRREKI